MHFSLLAHYPAQGGERGEQLPQDQSRQAGHIKAIERHKRKSSIDRGKKRETEKRRKGERDSRRSSEFFGNNFIIAAIWEAQLLPVEEEEAKTNDSHTHTLRERETHTHALGQTYGRPRQVRTLSKFLKTHSRLCCALITTHSEATLAKGGRSVQRGQPCRTAT